MHTSESDIDWLKTRSASAGSLRPTACDTSAIVPTPSVCVSAITTNIADARRADPREGGVAELRDEVQVDQEIERLGQHAGRDGRGHGHEVPGNRALGQVAHGGGVRWYTTAGCGGQAVEQGENR